MGRIKIEFDEEDIRQVETMSGLGLNMDEIAAILGVSKDTVERRMNENGDLKAAIERGRAVAKNVITRTAYEMAKKGTVPAMTMFWLKCRANWTEKNVHELTGPDGGPIQQSVLFEFIPYEPKITSGSDNGETD